MDVQKTIEAFGGQSALARAVGLKQQHVFNWKKAGRIPEWRIDAIRQAASCEGIVLDDEPKQVG